ncbi:AMP-binding protein [Arcanobacterium ihumii]|uniref:AMP-binding protein n=1 Tax=Arcanobacterium ihumii TaxID=2138162 RepID=UPI000F53B091|nr:AMP-binding protein [Arcanobacterium ihumii]
MTEKMRLREVWADQCIAQANREFLVYEDPDCGVILTYTYEEFDALTDSVSRILIGRGINFGDRVLVLLGNSVEFVALHLALSKIGAVLVPMNEMSSEEEIDYCIKFTKPKIVVTTLAISAKLQDLNSYPELNEKIQNAYFIHLDEFSKKQEEKGVPYVAELVVGENQCASAQLDVGGIPAENELAEIMMTSGTTSAPKGVMLTQYNFVHAGRYVNWELSMTSSDRYATAMAVSHVNFQLSALLPVITAGATLILFKRYSATTFWKSVQRHQATLIQSMAMMVRTILLQPQSPGEQNHNIREVHYFLPLLDSEKLAFEKRFRVRLLNNYGSTESLVGVITDLPGEKRNWPSIGKIGTGYDAEIRDDDGRPVSSKTPGTLWIKGVPGKTLMAGYWQDPTQTARTLVDGWYNSGDIAYKDADGWYFYLGRRSELIKRAGENVSALEVERVLSQCPGIAEVCVVGVPDPISDEAVKAFVVLKQGAELTAVQIIEYARKRLSYFKVPTIVTFIDELPRGQYGKVRRKLLK